MTTEPITDDEVRQLVDLFRPIPRGMCIDATERRNAAYDSMPKLLTRIASDAKKITALTTEVERLRNVDPFKPPKTPTLAIDHPDLFPS